MWVASEINDSLECLFQLASVDLSCEFFFGRSHLIVSISASLSLLCCCISTWASRVWSFGFFPSHSLPLILSAGVSLWIPQTPYEIIFIGKFARNFFSLLSISLIRRYLPNCVLNWLCELTAVLKHWTIWNIDWFGFCSNFIASKTVALAVVANEIFHIGLVICCLQGRFTDLFGNFSSVRQPFLHIHTFELRCKFSAVRVCIETRHLKSKDMQKRWRGLCSWNINNIKKPSKGKIVGNQIKSNELRASIAFIHLSQLCTRKAFTTLSQRFYLSLR